MKFSTYAYSWINKYMIQEYIKARYPSHIPEKKLRKLGEGNRILHRLEKELGREPTYGELVAEMAISMGGTASELNEVTRIIALGEVIYSLDMKIDKDSNTTFADILLEPKNVEDIDDILPKSLNDALDTLTMEEKQILELRFGIGTGTTSSLEELAIEFHISRYSIVKILAKGLRKLRHPSRSRKLKDFLD